MAKVNKMASKRFEERAESMKSDFSNFMEKQQGSFNKLANRWGLGDLINGDDDEGIHTLREENFVIFVVFVNNHYPMRPHHGYSTTGIEYYFP